MGKQYGIVAIGYNRRDSLKRLLDALNEAEFREEQVLLIISLDYSGMPEIRELAEQYHWKHGEKLVKAYTERQGLRKHILHCGDYIEEYHLDAVAVFEDDVIPSPAFYNYMVQAVPFYEKLGFLKKNTEQTENGIRYTPMQYLHRRKTHHV